MYLIFNSPNAGQNLNAAYNVINSIDALPGYFMGYTMPTRHPDGVFVAVHIINNKFKNLLTPEQQASVVENLTEDWGV